MLNHTTSINNIENSQYNILIIEDSKFINNAVKKNLAKFHYECDQVLSLNDARDKIEIKLYDFILLDLNLKDAFGLALMQNITSISDAKIIILTTDSDIEQRSNLFKAGILDYIIKDKDFNQSVSEIDFTIKKLELNKKSTILVIDDSKFIQHHIATILEVRNYNILSAINAKKGFEQLANNDSINLIILDMEMPDMHGLDVLHKIKQDKKLMQIPIIVLSGTGTSAIVRDSYKKGAYDFIQKPFNVEEFILKVDKSIESDRKSRKIQQAKIEVEELHRHTRDSIQSASYIQQAILADVKVFKKYFLDFFTLWQPKDIVGGDIYLFEELRNDDECLLMVIDCTGHGVPGAFVTMVVKALERQIISKIIRDDSYVVDTAWILSYFNSRMRKLLKQDNEDSPSNVGFDGQVMYFNKKEKVIKLASARNPIFYYQNDKLVTVKGDKHSVGYKDSNPDFLFTEHVLDATKETTLYLSTDGFIDQNGGEKSFPFGKKRFTKILDSIYKEKMSEQEESLLSDFHCYKREEEQNDDITVIGLKFPAL